MLFQRIIELPGVRGVCHIHFCFAAPDSVDGDCAVAEHLVQKALLEVYVVYFAKYNGLLLFV